MDPTWEVLKRLTGSSFAKYVILVPVIGWLLVYQNAFAGLLVEALGLQTTPTLGPELLVFYLGLIFLGISAGLFRALGPEPVLEHEGLRGYLVDQEAILTSKGFERFCLKAGIEKPSEIDKERVGTGQLLDFTNEQWKRLNQEPIRDTFTDHYEKMNTSRLIMRWILFLAFLLGALLSLIPTATTVAWSVAQLFQFYTGS